MKAKAPEQVKKSNKHRPAVKCDVCGRKFLTVSACKTHHKFLHSKSDTDKRVAFKKPGNTRAPKKKLIPLLLLKRVNPPKLEKAGNTVEPVKAMESPVQSPSSTKKAEFECPVCQLKYPVYFTAFRHIQKNHCIDEHGEKVPPNSPSLVKPIRIETCASCNQEIRSTIPHDCPKMQALIEQYMCLGCDQGFCSLVLFQHHIKGLHADETQNYFFPSRKEFEEWKTALQEAIKIEFTRLNKQKGKEVYHCSFQTNTSINTTRLCPASISMKEYSRGIHVCYFKEHCGHTIEHVLLKNFNKYNIPLYTKDTDDMTIEAEEDNELYVEFRNVLKSIITDAAKVDVAMLRDLLGRALEMTSILKNYHGEEHNSTMNNKNLSDDQIAKSLDSLKPKGKRKQSFEKKSENLIMKKVKKTPPPPPSPVENGRTTRYNKNNIVSKTVSFNKSGKQKSEKTTIAKELQELLEEDSSKTATKKTEEPLKGVLKKSEEPQPKVLDVKKPEAPVQSLIQSPTSFNDSYKHFVSQNFKSITESSTPKTKANVKTESSTPKIKANVKTESSTPKIKANVKTESSTPKIKANVKTESSTPKIKANVKTESSTPKIKANVKKKEVVKTKIGQFKHKPASPKNVSPKSPKTVKEVIKEDPIISLPLKVKPDIKYIVKEQENDCNILILKI